MLTQGDHRPDVLVVEANMIVAVDIAETVALHLPQARVTRVSSPEAAVSRLTLADMPPDLVLVGFSSERLRQSGLSDVLRARATRVVLIGDQDLQRDPAPEGWLTLEKPFTTDMLEAALRRALVCA
ncbi:hypothetical protein [Phaeovulum sp. W22_SRMD_FR3]|uniref:hypothetical protein n=1 Tax=Phaeovulum sp. W22_SRMD_FR3 TaxID=3240274 RepID=UPI003F9C2C7F